jgi:ribosomal protein L34
LAANGLAVLHDRRIPGSKANIDHIAITGSGIWVIDAKRYKGRPELKVEGGVLRPRVEKLLIGQRDCTKLVDGVLKQVDVVRDVVGVFRSLGRCASSKPIGP